MGRILKRVPLDFDYPLDTAWYGYHTNFCFDAEYETDGCDNCKRFAKLKGLKLTSSGCPDFEPFLGPPKGEGFQLWGTTSEGRPISPVFKTLDELCEWCEVNATTFADYKATKEEWKKMLGGSAVRVKLGNAIII